jgi:hypothetical protein
MRDKKLILPLVFLVILGIFIISSRIINSSRLNELIREPKAGDIYILEHDEVYAPIRISEVTHSQLSFYQYYYSFGEAIPDREQILDHEWDHEFVAIYERSEINSMFEEGRIAEIYRD